MKELWTSLYNYVMSTEPPECPDCTDRLADEYEDSQNRPRAPALEQGYTRDPTSQEHWRGVKSLTCPECGYAERAETAETGQTW